MDALLTVITLLILRLVLPFGLVLLLGTLAERRAAAWRRLAG